MNSKVLQIIDVNYNRATEGIRVAEEVCRFILEDKAATLKLKKMRGAMAILVRKEKMLPARKAEEDIGRKSYTKSEAKRGSIVEVFQANLKRAQEALRCLEEFSKLSNPTAGREFKALRFQLYEIEKKLAVKVSKADKLNFDLYVVSDPLADHYQSLKAALAGGAKMIQLRDKKMVPREYFKLARKIVPLARKSGAAFIINDYWEMVRQVGADGVHVGQEDIKRYPLKKVREIVGEDKIIGVSTHSFKEALRAAKEGADYISVGPIFKTPSKPLGKPVGLSLLKRVIKRVKVPVVAIGGIDQNNIEQVMNAGAKRAAVIRAVVGSSDPAKAARWIKRLMAENLS